MTAGAVITFRPARIDAGAGAELIDAMRAEIATLYDDLVLDGPEMPAAGPADLSPPYGTFTVGWRDGRPVCCGGVKRLDAATCEIKRMYVVPDARGQRVARALLRELEASARRLGYTAARLDTGPEQPHAQRLYRSEGYREIGNFNGNPVATFFGEKPLA